MINPSLYGDGQMGGTVAAGWPPGGHALLLYACKCAEDVTEIGR